MKINISNLSQGAHEYKLSKEAVELGLKENFFGDVVAKVIVDKSSRQILLRAGIRSNAHFHCDRCLDGFDKEVATTLQTFYVWSTEELEGNKYDDVRTLSADMNIIDISGDVRDVVLLAVPLKLLCKDDCAGLCPRCGKNLNHMPDGICDCAPRDLDPRWNKLAGLVEVSIAKKKN